MDRDVKYDRALDAVYRSYAPKVLSKLRKIREACLEAGLICDEPVDETTDEYGWTMLVWESSKVADDPTLAIAVNITIEEQREHEREDGYGINFAISLIGDGGKVLGGVTPYNYTPFVWVDARIEEVVEERWKIIEALDDFPIPTLILEGR